MIDGEKVKELRGDRTQREVAAEADITAATLSAIENGHNKYPDMLTVIKLARALNVKAEALVTGEWRE